MNSQLDNLLSRLEGVRRGREIHAARCPAHEDQKASLSIREGNDGKVLVHCHAGCDVGSIVGAIGLTISDLFPDSTSNGASSGSFTLEELSRQRRLPMDFLRSLGLTSSGSYIHVPYFQADGTGTRPQLRARDGEHRWGKSGSLPIIPYGLNRLDSEEAALVEGASDCWTLWHAGFPAIGIPGASMHRKLEAEHIRGLKLIYVVKESDDGGRTFDSNIRGRLDELGFSGDVRTVDMEQLDANDPSALYQRDPDGFAEKWRGALAYARKETVKTDNTDRTDNRQGDDSKRITGPPISASVYEGLPDDIRHACLLLREGHERDIFLTALLPVLSAGFPNILTKYARRWKALALNIAVVAPAGAGKGVLQLAGECAGPIDSRLREESATISKSWADLDAEQRGPEPPERSLRLAADASARGLLDTLAANGGRGLLFETEIKTLSDSLRPEWGAFKSLLLKAAEQEPIERVRKGEAKLYIRRPELPTVLSGTPSSFTEWIGGTEDGLFSRWLFYVFDAPPVWVDQFDDDEDEELDAALTQMGNVLDEAHIALARRPEDENGRSKPLYFGFERKQRDRLNAVFARRLEAADVADRPSLFASVKRGAFQAVRIAGVLAAYRLQSSGSDLGKITSYAPTEDEVEAAIALACCYLDHAAALSLCFERDPRATIKSEERSKFLTLLPNEFLTATAHEIGKKIGMSRSGVERAITALTDRHKLLTRVRHGQYRKASANPSPLKEVTDPKEVTEIGQNGTPFPSDPSVPSDPSSPSDNGENTGGGAAMTEGSGEWDSYPADGGGL